MVFFKLKTIPVILLCAGMLSRAEAEFAFGMGDEKQQLLQLKQLQMKAGSTNLAAASPSSIPIANAFGSGATTVANIPSPAQTALQVKSNANTLVAQTPLPGPASNATLESPSFSTASNPIPQGNASAPPATFSDISQQVNAAISSVSLSASAAASNEAAQLNQLTPAFTPYTGPSNRFTSLPSNEQVINESAFNNVVSGNFPMTVDQIHALKQAYYASQQAATAAPGVPPRPVVTTQLVSTAPGSTPPVVRLSQGFVSSLVFVDSSGAPWPIEAYDIGNPGAFSIQWNHSDNTLMMQAMTLYTYGNMAVRLKNLSTPVMLTLIPGQRVVDYRVDLRVQGLGPNAKTAGMGDMLPEAANTELMGVLDGVPPHGAKSLTILGGEAQAWVAQDKMYLRTRLTLLSPAWNATMSSADGMKAYELQRAPMLLVSAHGKPTQLRVEGL